jgi:putative acyl-CoA dehydrogenase
MVTMTRLDCVIGSAAVQRAALTQAMHHIGGRAAFGRRLADQPLMQEVVADLAIEVEAASALFVRLATAVDGGEAPLLRLAVATGKFWVCKRTSTVVGEALECLGGAGYVEESPLPRYFRESPLNSIWEGSGNVIALDVIRGIGREPASVQALQEELALTAGSDPRLDRAVDDLGKRVAALGTDPDADARSARSLAGLLARTLQAHLLVRSAADEARSVVAECYLSTRLDGPPAMVAADRPALGRVATSALLEYTNPGKG